jgi:hypothetical protein
MYMGLSVGPFKNAGDEDFIFMQLNPADRADSGPISVDAIGTAFNVHEPVFAGKRRKGHGFYQAAFFKAGRTDRTGLRVAGAALSPGRTFLLFGIHDKEPFSRAQKKSIAEPEQRHPYRNQG